MDNQPCEHGHMHFCTACGIHKEETTQVIKLDKNQVDVMGRPNFMCSKIAWMLIADGIYEDKEKASEYEQAVFIHWALNLLKEHGDQWNDEANKILKGCAERAKKALTAQAKGDQS